MIKQVIPLFLVVLAAFVASETYFKENFENGIDKWVVSDWKGDSQGKFEWSAGANVKEGSAKGLKTTEDNRFYTASARFDKEFSNKGKDLVIQYSVRHEASIECGGSYIKLYPGDFDQTHLDGEQKYNVMFGPDSCGSTRVVHFILNYNGQNHQLKKKVKPETDTISHLYTLIIRPNNSYEILIDGESKQVGNLEEDFDLLPPKEINDPNASKPADWVDLETIADPNDVKPEGWDVPETIEDTSAKKPEDWDDEVDGDWEPPRIPNPDFKGEWKAKKIPNPEYKGKWVHPQIPNPEYKEDADLYAYDSFSTVAVEVWQVKAVSIFNDFLITDSVEEAKAATEEFLKKQETEKEEKKRLDEEKKKEREDSKKAEEEKLKEVAEKIETETKEVVQEKTEEAATEKKDEL